MAYKASDLFSGTWQNVPGITALWQSDQNPLLRGFCIYVEGYNSYEGKEYYEWGYVIKDSDLDGILKLMKHIKVNLESKMVLAT